MNGIRSDEDDGVCGMQSDEDEGRDYMRCSQMRPMREYMGRGEMRMRMYYTLRRMIVSECDICTVSEH